MKTQKQIRYEKAITYLAKNRAYMALDPIMKKALQMASGYVNMTVYYALKELTNSKEL